MAEFFQAINSSLWNGSWFQWFAYFGIVLVLLFEKNKGVKLIFGVYPLVFLLLLFNPLTYKLTTLFFNEQTVDLSRGFGSYWRRMYAMSPYMYCIALGFVLLARKLKGIWKLAGVCMLGAVLVLSGNNVYMADWMQPAKNRAKVPQDVLEISWLFRNEDGHRNIAVPDDMSSYLRQVDAELLMPYGRNDVNALQAAVNRLDRSAEAIMTEAGKRAVDFVTVRKSDNARALFSAAGYIPWAETSNYLIYEVTGVPCIRRTLNETGQILTETSCDAEGNPAVNSKGYVTDAYEYDSNGYRIRQTYYDAEGTVFSRKNGVAGYAWTRTPGGRLRTETTLDAEGSPLEVNGYTTVMKDYNRDRMLQSETYCDEAGNPVINSSGYAVKTFEYNGNKRKSREDFYDMEGNRVNGSGGYASITYEYTDGGSLALTRYYSAEGVLLPLGSANLHEYLQRLQDRDYTVFFAAQGDCAAGLTDPLSEDFRMLGIQTDLRSLQNGSFCAVVSPEGVTELSDPNVDVSLEGLVGALHYSILSGGNNAGSASSIVLDDTEYSPKARGMNIVVVENGIVKDAVAFDTHTQVMKMTGSF